MVYIGVDLHRKKSQVAALDQDGNLVFNRKVRTGPGEMACSVKRDLRAASAGRPHLAKHGPGPCGSGLGAVTVASTVESTRCLRMCDEGALAAIRCDSSRSPAGPANRSAVVAPQGTVRLVPP